MCPAWYRAVPATNWHEGAKRRCGLPEEQAPAPHLILGDTHRSPAQRALKSPGPPAAPMSGGPVRLRMRGPCTHTCNFCSSTTSGRRGGSTSYGEGRPRGRSEKIYQRLPWEIYQRLLAAPPMPACVHSQQCPPLANLHLASRCLGRGILTPPASGGDRGGGDSLQ